MSRILSAVDIASRALRAIGAFPVTESSADGEQLREAMTWLDLIMAETSGTERLFSRMTPTTLPLLITNGTQTYNLYNALGTNLPPDKVQFITDAFVDDAAGNRFEIQIVNREKFEDVAKPATTGTPRWIYIDRTGNPTLQLFPTPDVTDPTVWTLKLVCQTYAPNVAPGGVTGLLPLASVLHDFGQAWQRWLILQLAHDLGSGPIHALPQERITNFLAMAGSAKLRLLAFENRQQETTPPIGEAPSGWLDDDCFDARTFPRDYGNRRGW
jgi:hypothetical protein